MATKTPVLPESRLVDFFECAAKAPLTGSAHVAQVLISEKALNRFIVHSKFSKVNFAGACCCFSKKSSGVRSNFGPHLARQSLPTAMKKLFRKKGNFGDFECND